MTRMEDGPLKKVTEEITDRWSLLQLTDEVEQKGQTLVDAQRDLYDAQRRLTDNYNNLVGTEAWNSLSPDEQERVRGYLLEE